MAGWWRAASTTNGIYNNRLVLIKSAAQKGGALNMLHYCSSVQRIATQGCRYKKQWLVF